MKPTLSNPVGTQSKNYENNFRSKVGNTPINLSEVDKFLGEDENSLKKKIFSLPKMESLVFSDPRLTTVYDEMAEDGETKYGYHYNETIMNIIFNDYVLNSPVYLQKYKQAIPKKKKRRDKSGINQLKIAVSGVDDSKPETKKDVNENDDGTIRVIFLVNGKDSSNQEVFAYFPDENYDADGKYKSAYSHIGQHSSCDPRYAKESRPATPEEYQDLKNELEGIGYNLDIIESGINETSTSGSVGGSGMGSGGYATPHAWGGGDLMKGKKGKVMRKPIWQGGTIIQESNYLIDTDGFEKLVESLNENYDLETAKNIAKENSKEGYAQHVNQCGDGKYSVSDWYDDDTTICGYENGNELNEDMSNTGNMYTTAEDLKGLFQQLRQEGKKLSREHIPMLAGDALYKVAIKFANNMLPLNWDDFPDTNSMWDYINENGNMSYNNFIKAIKRAVKDRLSGADMGVGLYENEIDEHHLNDRESKINYIVSASSKLDSSKIMGNLNQQKMLNDLDDETINTIYLNMENELKSKGIDPMSVSETDQSMIDSNPQTMANYPKPVGDLGTAVDMGTQSSGGIRENIIKEKNISKMNKNEKIFEELDNELNAYMIHQNKLEKMYEDRKPSSLVNVDRLGGENKKNFKSDLQHSGTKEIINVEKELQWKDQQTEIGKDPQKLGSDIEKEIIKKTGGNALENVGDSTNSKGNEIPKRNATDDEVEEVEKYRLGMESLDYDTTNDKFESRAKVGMGEKLYDKGRKQVKAKTEMPLYNKDVAPATTKDTSKDKWYKDANLKEYVVNGKYNNALNKRTLIGFTPKDVLMIENAENLYKIDFVGVGNAIDNKGNVNESVNNLLTENTFYTNGVKVYVIKNKKNDLNESVKKENKVVNEQFDKMKHLLSYKPKNFINTTQTKANRGF